MERSLEADVEYGNVGVDFELAPDGGFGWTNASFQIGCRRMPERQREMLRRLVPPEWLGDAWSQPDEE